MFPEATPDMSAITSASPPPLRVLFVAEGLDMPETYMIKGLGDEGVHITVIARPDDPYAALLSQVGITVHERQFKSRLDVGSIRFLRRLIKSERFDLVHCLRNNRPVANVLIAVRGLKVAVVAYRGTMGNLSRWNPGSHLTYLSRRLAKVVCVSNGVLAYLKTQGVDDNRLITIYKGHDPTWYENFPLVDLSEEFNIPPTEITVCCVANMRPLKGVHVLIGALSQLPPFPKIHLLLVGKVLDEQIPEMAQAYRGPHAIHLAGFRQDAAGIIRSCTMFVMPSLRREGLPRAVIEAMCNNKPVIVTAVGGMRELVEHRVSGRIVQPGSARELARSIALFAGDSPLRKQTGEEARARIEDRFHVRVTVTKTRELYRDITGR